MVEIKKQTKNFPLGYNIKLNRPYSVILVDDSQIERTLLKRIMLHKEFSVFLELSNGKEAIERITNMIIKPDIVFLDYEMPIKNGLDTLKAIKQDAPETRVVIVTHHTEKEVISDLFKYKADSIIIKPINDAKITEKMAVLLGRKDLLPKEVIEYKSSSIDLATIEIPPLPTVTIKILTFDTNSPQGGSAELEKIISPDKAISTSILRIANSAYYGRNGTIKTLKDAITLLGMQTIKNLIFLQSRKNLSKQLPDSIFKKHLQELPVLNALISFDLSTPIGLKKFAENAFLSALLKNIGMTILAISFSKSYAEILKLSEFGIKSIYELEKEKFNSTSIDLGEKAFKYWKLPDDFIQTVRNQNFSLDNINNVSDLDCLARMGDILARRMMGFVINSNDEEILNQLLKKYNAPEETKELFNEDYYEMIKEHPFLELAMK